jgi:hypothetical protein
MDPAKYRHAQLVLKAWFDGGNVTKDHFYQLKNYAIENYKYQNFTPVPVTTAPGSSALHDCSHLHDFGFDLLPQKEMTEFCFLPALILDLVRQSNNLFLGAC